MIRRLILRWLAPDRDASGKFVSAHHERVIEVARQMRAGMPGKEWKRPI